MSDTCTTCNGLGHYYTLENGMEKVDCNHKPAPDAALPVEAPKSEPVNEDPPPKSRRTKAASGDGTAKETRRNQNDPGSK